MTVITENRFSGSLRSLLRIFLPLILILFCEALVTYCESLLLSHSGKNAIYASLNATYLGNIFQSSCIAAALLAQVFVGHHHGENEPQKIGGCVWQFVWFALFSMILTWPLSKLTASLFFKQTIIEDAGLAYFSIVALGNFLYPLNAALASFYWGRGKTLMMTAFLLGTYAIHLMLSAVLIFGWEGFIPALNVRGAAFAKIASQALLCCILFACFLSKNNRLLFATADWRLYPARLWHYLRPGLVRAFGLFSSKSSWAFISHIMISQGERYIAILTIGGVVINFLIFFGTGIHRANLTLASNLMGAQQYDEMRRLFYSTLALGALISAALLIPVVFFPQMLISFLGTAGTADFFQQTFISIRYGIWLHLASFILQFGLNGLNIARRDLKFQIFLYSSVWITSFLPVYFLIGQRHMEPSTLWSITALENIIFGIVLAWRFRVVQLKALRESTAAVRL